MRVRPLEDLRWVVGVSLRAVAPQFCLCHRAVAGADSPVQVAENAAALTEQILEDL